jgi:N6-adenosine-specific RNA methylase IME4
VTQLFTPLPTVPGGFACILADVPSRFRSNSIAKPGRNALRHYACHSMETIATLPIADVAARDALLFFWTTGPLISIGAHIPVIRAWGFEPTAMGFVWVKLNPRASTHRTRSLFRTRINDAKERRVCRPLPAWSPRADRQGRVRDHPRTASRIRSQAG